MDTTNYTKILDSLRAQPRTWLITGAAGFIGSHLAEELLRLDQKVIGLDNFYSGKPSNLEQIKNSVANKWSNFRFIEGSIEDAKTCSLACAEANIVLHQAAAGSVPGSIENPIASVSANILGSYHLMLAAKEARVDRFVYASSSSVYGDSLNTKEEDRSGKLLSTYALTKFVNELSAGVLHRNYGLNSIGLRYFNVFGPRQSTEGSYAAVIPIWVKSLLLNQPVYVNGDGETTRDFCHISNVVQANILAAVCDRPEALNQVYNIGYGKKITLNELLSILKGVLAKESPAVLDYRAYFREFRDGDIRHSVANVDKARALLGYEPNISIQEGIERSIAWYKENLSE